MAYGSGVYGREGSDTKFHPMSLGVDVTRQAEHVLKLCNDLKNTYPEWNVNQHRRQRQKEQNAAANSFRYQFSCLVDLVRAHLEYNCKEHLDDKDKAMITRTKQLLTLPLGSYDIRELTDSAQQWYDLLIKSKTIILTPGINVKDNFSDFRGL